MEKSKITQAAALETLKAGGGLAAYEVVLDGTPIEALDALNLRSNGISIPDDLVYYDDENIDYSDIPETDDGFWKEAVSAREGGEREYMRRMLLKEIDRIDIEHLPDLLEMVRTFRQKLPPEA